jgi:hypothetical protein
MGIGFCLTGAYEVRAFGQSPEDWLDEVAAWLEGRETEPLMDCRVGTDDQDRPSLYLQVHPSAEEVEFTVPAPGRLVVSARTSAVGPGYHIFLCDLLHSLAGPFRVTWDPPDAERETGDETTYFFSRDTAAVRTEMLRWLTALAHLVTEETFADASQIRMVSMPLGYAYPDEAAVVTPLGPRPMGWFADVIRRPTRGIDFFPWWEPGCGAGYYLGRALCRMWQDVRWRTPVNDAEGELLMDVHLDLERAYRLEPAGPLPWREWAELLEYLTDFFGYVEFQAGDGFEDEIVSRARQTLGGPRIGYRRGTVQVALSGGWSIRIPGELAEEWETNGQTWSAWLGGRTVWFTSWSLRAGEEPQPAGEILRDLDLPDGETFEFASGNVLGRAVFVAHEEDGDRLWNLKAYSAVDGGFALCNVFVEHRDDLDWALDVWRTLEN